MSLLEEQMETFAFIDKTTQPDGYGSVIPVYVEGAPFQAAVANMQPDEIIAAQQAGIKAQYHIITRKDINLTYGTIVQRKSDGKYFMARSDGTDKKTPSSAGLDMRVVDAEDIKQLPTT